MENVENRVLQIISQQLRIPQTNLTPEAHFVEDLGIDSVDFIELMMHLEKEFGVKIPDDQIKRMRSVKDVTTRIEQMVSASARNLKH